jgi:hypothetical protein
VIGEGLFEKPAEHDVFPKEIQIAGAVADPEGALTDQPSDAGALHGPEDVSGTDRADRALSARPEGADNGIVAGHGTFESGLIEDVSLDQGRLPLGVLDLELFGVAGEGGHLVAEGERLVNQVATDRTSRTEDDELDGVLLFSFDCW